MSSSDRKSASEKILKRLVQLPPYQEARGIHCYISMRDEVETDAIFESCWKASKNTYVPYQIPEKNELGMARRRPGDSLITGPFRVPEPAPEMREPVAEEEIDLVLVPGVAFDPQGNRLGYGRGYYDNFLTRLSSYFVTHDKSIHYTRRTPQFVGVAFSVQIVAVLPHSTWDVKLGTIVTDREVITVH